VPDRVPDPLEARLSAPDPAPQKAPSTRDRLLDTAEELFARHGYAGVGMREVAERVGIGKSSLFHHFPSKAYLYVAALERVLARIDASLASSAAAEGGALGRLDRWIEALVDLFGANPPFAPLLLRSLFADNGIDPARLEEADRLLARILERSSGLLQHGIETGELRATSVPHTLQSLIGLTVYHFASGAFGEQLLGGSLNAPDEIERRKREIRELVHTGLAAGPRVEPRS
jgi:AcrR family transcriptional regulator